MIDLYKYNHVRACVCAFVNFFFKKTSQKLLTGLLPNFIVVFLRLRLKSSLHRNRKIRPVERYRCSSTSSMCLQYKSFENSVGKGEIVRNEQFILIQGSLCRSPLSQNATKK